MKRRAPETLLEFCDYIQPAKRAKLSNERLEAPSAAISERYQYAYDEADLAPSPLASPSDQNSYESDSHEEVANSPVIKRRRSSSEISLDDFDIDSFLSQDPLADKPSNCRKPHKTLVQAIKWITENKKILQKEISDALGVSPSTLSLYMNNTPRQHGWKLLERKIVDWMRSILGTKQNLDFVPKTSVPIQSPVIPEYQYGWSEELDYSSFYNTRVQSNNAISFSPYQLADNSYNFLALELNILFNAEPSDSSISI